jgi:hypothetical protein
MNLECLTALVTTRSALCRPTGVGGYEYFLDTSLSQRANALGMPARPEYGVCLSPLVHTASVSPSHSGHIAGLQTSAPQGQNMYFDTCATLRLTPERRVHHRLFVF